MPLVKCDVSNGGTEFVPGTHADWTASSNSYVLDAAPGDALVADWRLKHRGLANRTREDRPLLYLTYWRGPWFVDKWSRRRDAAPLPPLRAVWTRRAERADIRDAA